MKKLFLITLLIFSSTVLASSTVWVDDSKGTIGKVVSDTGAVTVVGNSGVILTDIAFDPKDNLYGVSFDSLYSINQTSGKATLIGKLGVNDANSLVFGSDGTLYSAGVSTKNLYKIDPKTGKATVLFNTGYYSGGDLAFVNSDLYYTDGQNLLLINLTSKTTKLVGPIGAQPVYGLINGGDGSVYAVVLNDVYSVNINTGKGTKLSSWNVSTLNIAYGSTVMGEAKPKLAGVSGPVSWQEKSSDSVEIDPIKENLATQRAKKLNQNKSNEKN